MRGKTFLLALATCAALAACGGGDDNTTTTAGTGASPASGSGSGAGTPSGTAFGSVEGFLAYMRQVLGGGDDTAEPLALPATAAPISDTGEPAAI